MQRAVKGAAVAGLTHGSWAEQGCINPKTAKSLPGKCQHVCMLFIAAWATHPWCTPVYAAGALVSIYVFAPKRRCACGRKRSSRALGHSSGRARKVHTLKITARGEVACDVPEMSPFPLSHLAMLCGVQAVGPYLSHWPIMQTSSLACQGNGLHAYRQWLSGWHAECVHAIVSRWCQSQRMHGNQVESTSMHHPGRRAQITPTGVCICMQGPDALRPGGPMC